MFLASLNYLKILQPIRLAYRVVLPQQIKLLSSNIPAYRVVLPQQIKLLSSNIPGDNKVNNLKKMETIAELRKRLTPLQYQVTQEAATERPFSGCYNKHYEKGIYQCIVCHQDLFSSDTKFDSGCGWPAFNDVLDQGKISLHRDASIAGGNILLLIKHPERIRTEVRCAKCKAHMGHVFEDGPEPTRKRYCINSAAIEFISADQLNTTNSQCKTATS